MKFIFFAGLLLSLLIDPICAQSHIRSNKPIYAQNENNKDGFASLNNTEQTIDTTVSAENDWFVDENSNTVDSVLMAESTVEEGEDHTTVVYPLIEIGATTMLLYFFTWLLTKFKVLKISVHRKIWNVILLLSFMVSGLLGLMLVIQINYNVLADWYSTFMWLHVDFGIVMALISVFHILWHTKYFGLLFRKHK